MRIKHLVYKIEDGELIADSFFDKEEDALWKVAYMKGKQGSRIGEPSMGDYKTIKVISHE